MRERKNVCYGGAPIHKNIQFKPEGKTNTEIQFKLQIVYIFRKHLCFVDHFFFAFRFLPLDVFVVFYLHYVCTRHFVVGMHRRLGFPIFFYRIFARLKHLIRLANFG